MTGQKSGAARLSITSPEIEAATPPRRPAPMPTQTVVFWTPRRILMESARVMIVPRRLPGIARSAISVANIDDPR